MWFIQVNKLSFPQSNSEEKRKIRLNSSIKLDLLFSRVNRLSVSETLSYPWSVTSPAWSFWPLTYPIPVQNSVLVTHSRSYSFTKHLLSACTNCSHWTDCQKSKAKKIPIPDFREGTVCQEGGRLTSHLWYKPLPSTVGQGGGVRRSNGRLTKCP